LEGGETKRREEKLLKRSFLSVGEGQPAGLKEQAGWHNDFSLQAASMVPVAGKLLQLCLSVTGSNSQ
jgi:hypothetical protein